MIVALIGASGYRFYIEQDLALLGHDSEIKAVPDIPALKNMNLPQLDLAVLFLTENNSDDIMRIHDLKAMYPFMLVVAMSSRSELADQAVTAGADGAVEEFDVMYGYRFMEPFVHNNK